MKKFVNDPKQFVPEMLKGIALANPDTIKYVPEYNLIMRADAPSNDKVSIVQGSGSGHEPAHVMVVGPGMLQIIGVLSLVLGWASGLGLERTLLGVLASSVIGYLVLAGFGLLVARLEHARWQGMAKAVLGFPIWLFSWSVINVVVLFYRDPTWHTVAHTDSLSLAESAALIGRDVS
mgnify:CR=1 FL=1